MKKTALVNGVLIGLAALAIGFAACPIAPDFPSDSGVDSGVDDSGVDDAGPIDAGAYGSIGATLTTSNGISNEILAWNNAEVETSTLDTTMQATLRAVDPISYGTLTLQLTNLTVDGTGAQVNAATYSPVSGADSWSCEPSSNPCNAQVIISDFDGIDLSGSFEIIFSADGDFNTAELSSGSFSVTL